MDNNVIRDAFTSQSKKGYLSDKMVNLINSLIAAEFNAQQLYKSMVTCNLDLAKDKFVVIS